MFLPQFDVNSWNEGVHSSHGNWERAKSILLFLLHSWGALEFILKTNGSKKSKLQKLWFSLTSFPNRNNFISQSICYGKHLGHSLPACGRTSAEAEGLARAIFPWKRSLDGILLPEFTPETPTLLYLEHFPALIPILISGTLKGCAGWRELVWITFISIYLVLW